MTTKEKLIKKKGPIRFEAILPVGIIFTVTYFYFSWYFDKHLQKVIEYIATQANGAEVNIASIHTSFIRASFKLNGLQVTDVERPTHNTIDIENIHFQYNWDALLRMKFVVEDASINSIQVNKKRTKPGFVVPPAPATPSKIEKLQKQVISQIKNKYSDNMLGDLVTLLDGGDYQKQIENIRETLQSEKRIKEMISTVQNKKTFWDSKIKELSDPTALKNIEATLQSVKKEKNFLEQAKGVQELTNQLKVIEKQYQEIQKSSRELQAEVKTLTGYPEEIKKIIEEDMSSLKNRFSVPEMDFKDLAMHLFAGEFSQYISKARKYQALANQYLPEKKKEEEIIPPKRAEGKNYTFPITSGHPLFWLKRAAISSKGTPESYTGEVSGQLTNVTTSPQLIKKPIVLELKGDFPSEKIMGVSAVITADYTRDLSKHSFELKVNSFPVPEKMFTQTEKLTFGLLSAKGMSSLSGVIEEEKFQMNWNSLLSEAKFVVETKNKIASEILSNIVNQLPSVTIDGGVSGNFDKFNMNLSSNLGTELSQGFQREISQKINEAKAKIEALIEEKIGKPKQELMASLGENNNQLSKINGLVDLYKKNEDRIKVEIEKFKKNGGVQDLKEKGKKLLKGFKL